ncbi:MAG: hypothetical protein AAFQ40_13740 [Cyanobacteria bacterium J06623_5]
MGIKASLALAAVPVLFAIAPAQAGTFVFEESNLGGNKRVGKHEYIKAEYDSDTEVFSWTSTFSRNTNNGRLADGAWLVISDGEDPKNNVDEYAILYMDGTTGNVSIYNYDGVNGSDSYKNETFLGNTALTVDNSVTDERTFSFSLDATTINDMTSTFGNDWDGIAFDRKIGIWLHGVDELTTTYKNNDPNQGLDKFNYKKQGWYDVSHKDATKVPEPGSVAAIGLFATAAATQLRKRLG